MPTRRTRPIRQAATQAVSRIKAQHKRITKKLKDKDAKDTNNPDPKSKKTDERKEKSPEKPKATTSKDTAKEDTNDDPTETPPSAVTTNIDGDDIFEDEVSEESQVSEDSDEPRGIGNVRFEGLELDNAEGNNAPSSTRTVHYRARRLALMIHIPEVDNNTDRLYHIVQEVNAFIKVARKKNDKFRLRKFQDTTPPNITDRKKWRTTMKKDNSSDFCEYIQGYYPFTPPRGGNYRFRIHAVMDSAMTVSEFIDNVMHDWGTKDCCSISDIKSQNIWNPVKIGYLMRASKYLTFSYELIEALEKQARKEASTVFFGVTWGTIPSPVGGYDRDTAVQAVMIETNRETTENAVRLLKKWYPLNPATEAEPPFPGHFRFVINKSNERVKNNPVAMANLSILMERQGIFNQDTRGEQTYCLKDITQPFNGEGTPTVREKLLATKVKTFGEEFKDSPLFLSVSTAINNRSGSQSVWFTYHKKFTKEAMSIVQNLPSFIKTEWKINPEYVCYAQFIHKEDTWDTENRVANNEDTDAIRLAAEVYTLDLKRTEEPENYNQDDGNSMNTKARKEMERMLGGDTETIASISQVKQIATTPMSITIDDRSQGGISGVSSKSSMARAKMKKDFDEQLAAQKQVFEKLQQEKQVQDQKQSVMEAQITALQNMLQSLKPSSLPEGILAIQSNQQFQDNDQDIEMDATSGQDTTESPPLMDTSNITQNMMQVFAQEDPPQAATNEVTQDTSHEFAQEEEDFISYTDDDYQHDISSIVNNALHALDRKPTSKELNKLYEKAKKIVDTELLERNAPPDIPPLPDSDSDDGPRTILTQHKQRIHLSNSEESQMEIENNQSLKRVLSTNSDEKSDTEEDTKFRTSGSPTPKKKSNATGSVTPDKNH